MQGAGNDFVVIDHDPKLDYAVFARKVCDRHMGIGADGVIIHGGSVRCDHRMRIFNADGSEAEMCGNGARCLAVYIASKFTAVPEVFSVETKAGTLHASVQGDIASVQLSDPENYLPGIEINVAGQKIMGHFLNTGVPHVVVFVQGLREMDVDGLGRLIRQHSLFAPKGTNVNFVEKVRDGVVAVRTFERGVEAETLACGTGSVAAALVGYLHSTGTLTPQKGAAIQVATKSGEILDVTFDLDVVNKGRPVMTNVWLKGSGKLICKGEYYF